MKNASDVKLVPNLLAKTKSLMNPLTLEMSVHEETVMDDRKMLIK